MKRFAAIFLCVILLFSLAACEQDEPSNANKSFQYHLAAEPETLDPQIAADESGIILIQALFEGLTRLDADGNAVPGVAESWTSNADFTQFTFQLRAGPRNQLVHMQPHVLHPKRSRRPCRGIAGGAAGGFRFRRPYFVCPTGIRL